jgi:hypothetical protein
MNNFQLHRNSFGRLVLTDTGGAIHEGVVPVHAFPISAPAEGVALVDADGHELVWLDNLTDLPVSTRTRCRKNWHAVIHRKHGILHVSTFATPSLWEVETDRGRTSFILKGEDDIRRLNHNTLLIADSNGIHYLIRDTHQLDKHSRKLLDRFL